MNRATQQRLRPMLRHLGGIATSVVLLPTLIHAQTSQFFFDPNGNLAVQMGETVFPPQILGQPKTQMVATGESAAFSVVVADPRSLTYQWRFNGVNLGSETGVSLVLDSVSTNNEGAYDVVLTNPSGSVTSAPAMLWIDSRGVGMPDSWQLAHFGNLNQLPNRDFDGDGSSNLQEFLNGTNPTNSASVLYSLTVVRDGGSVMKSPDLPGYTNGQTVTLTATAPSNESFHAWLGDVLTRDNPLTLVMTNNKTVDARFTPLTLIWTNYLVNGNWESATNWTPNLAPGTDDIVFIARGSAVTLNTAADCREFTLGGDGSPILTGSGSLLVRDSLLWSAGTISLDGPLTVRGDFSWAAGTMTGSGRTILETNAILNIQGSVALNARTLENRGTILWTASGSVSGDSIITNLPSALFRVEHQSGSLGGTGGRFDNGGVFRKVAGSGSLTVSSPFNNWGTVEVAGSGPSTLSSSFNNWGTVAAAGPGPMTVSGFFNNSGTVDMQGCTLTLNNGGTNLGSIGLSAAAGLRFAGGTHVASVSSSVTGEGQLTVSGGTANLAGLVNVSGSNTFSGGTANFTGNYIATNNTLTISGGTASFNGTGTVAPAVVNLSNGTLGGSNLVTVGSVMNWTAGTMGGGGRTILSPGATLNAAISGPATLGGRTLENGGTVQFTGSGSMDVNTGAVITNRPGAVFNFENEGAFGLGGFVPNGRFDNSGTFRKSAGTGTSIVSGLSFNNSGIVAIQTGTLSCTGSFTNNGVVNLSGGTTNRLLAGGSSSGAFNAPAGTLVEWTGGTFTLSTGAQLNGAGLYRLNGGSLTVNPNLIVENLDLIHSSSSLSGAGVVTVAGAMNWTAGTMSGSGRTIIPAGVTLNLALSSSATLARTLENGGTVLWTGAVLNVFSSAVITNRPGALFRAEGEAANGLGGFTANGRFDNAGTFRKSAGTGTTTVASGMKFTNYNTVDIRSGILAANGGYVSSSNALLNCALGGTTPGTGFGQLRVAGTVTLNGALSVDFINGFVPATNGSFTVLTAGTRNGAFGSFFYPSNAVTMQLSNTASSVIARVTDVFTVPQPAPVPPGLISWWRAEGNALDSVSTNHGVLTNGTTFNTGKVGRTFAFDGTDDVVQVPDSASLRPASVSIEAWVKFFATNGIRIVLVKPIGTGTFDSYELALQDGAVLAAVADNSGFGPFLTGPANTVTEQWYHLAFTFNDASKQQVLYVNGVPVASGTANKTMSYDTHPVLLGADVENGVLSFFHNGLIDEASIYNRALTSAEVVTIYNAGAAGKQLSAVPPVPLLLQPELIGTDIKLTWTAVSNATYRLEFNPNLAPSNWVALPGDATVSSNTAMKLDALTPSNRFYRVRVLP